MLFDPKWNEQKTEADLFSLDSLIAWLETMPKDEVYCFTDTGRCLLGQYFSHQGYQKVAVADVFFYHGGARDEPVFFSREFCDIAVERPRTFGAALERARSFALPKGKCEP